MSIHTESDFEFDASPGLITGDATFEYSAEFVPRQTDCGVYEDFTEVSGVELVKVQIGSNTLTRTWFMDADKCELERAEARITEEIQALYDSGEFLMAAE